jgi:hypothetical protein
MIWKSFRLTTAFCGLACLGLDIGVRADNPIVIGQGLTDPKVRIYNDRVYLYATHDASPKAKYFHMNDWWTWSSEDLVHWKYESTLKPEQTYWGKPCNECWATDAISHKGKYFFYFSRGNAELGVVEGDSPIGPWTDPLHQPLVAHGSAPTAARDPAILQEEDGTTYIIFGCWDYYIARLNDDMTSLAETPRKVELDQKMGPYGPGKTDDKSFLHKHNGKYYLSWGCFYAMSDNVYGPYTYKGCIITKERTATEFQKALVNDRHGSFFQLHHQWYFICNDQSWPGTSPYYRDSVISYVHYRDNGEIAPVYIDRIGVGQYDAEQPRIEAENYFKAEGVTQKECPEGGFELRDIRAGSYVGYPNVMNLPAEAVISFRVAIVSPQGATIEIHGNAVHGPLLGTCQVLGASRGTTYETVLTSLSNTAGKEDIYLVFRGGPGELLRLDWLSFQKQK